MTRHRTAHDSNPRCRCVAGSRWAALGRLADRFVRTSDGQDLIEYAVLAGFLSLIMVAALTGLGQGLSTVYANMADAVNGMGGGSGGSGG